MWASETKTFFYRHKNPVSETLLKIKIDYCPVLGLAEARVQLQELKFIRLFDCCPVAEENNIKQPFTIKITQLVIFCICLWSSARRNRNWDLAMATEHGSER